MKIFALGFLILLSSCLKPHEVENRSHLVTSMANTLDKQFPGVPSLSRSTLTKHSQLIDLRSSAERNISTIKNAISLDDYNADPKLYLDKQLVAFDTMGQRSIQWVSKKRAQGLDAYNLHGGILAWAHDGGSFVDQQGHDTKVVHVYSKAWDMLPEGFEAITE